jgi:hypothetical protein
MKPVETFFFGDDASISCFRTSHNSGEFMLSATNHPATFLFSMPAATAVALATSILEQANAALQEAA